MLTARANLRCVGEGVSPSPSPLRPEPVLHECPRRVSGSRGLRPWQPAQGQGCAGPACSWDKGSLGAVSQPLSVFGVQRPGQPGIVCAACSPADDGHFPVTQDCQGGPWPIPGRAWAPSSLFLGGGEGRRPLPLHPVWIFRALNRSNSSCSRMRRVTCSRRRRPRPSFQPHLGQVGSGEGQGTMCL